MSYNYWLYGYGNPVTYTDPTGRFPWPLIGIFIWISVSLTGDTRGHSISSGNEIVGEIALRSALDPVDIICQIYDCVYEECRFWDVVFALTPFFVGGISSQLDDIIDVRHATNPKHIDNILRGIDPTQFSKNARFGEAFYVSQDSATALSEIAAHGELAGEMINFKLDLSDVKLLDLSDPDIAKAWGYLPDESTNVLQDLAKKALEEGYNVIKFESVQGSGINYALFDNPMNPFKFDEWLLPFSPLGN